MIRPNIALPPISKAIINEVAAEYQADPMALRAKQIERVEVFNAGLPHIANVIADPSRRGMCREAPDPIAIGHYAMVFDVLNRQQAAMRGVCLDAMVDETRTDRLTRALANPDDPEAWMSKRIMGEQEESEIRNPRPIPLYQPNSCRQTLSQLTEGGMSNWQDAIAAHDSTMYNIIEGRTFPTGVETDYKRQQINGIGGVVVYAFVDALLQEKASP